MKLTPLALLACIGCYAGTSTDATNVVTVTGPLTLSVHDAPAQMGVMYALPSVETAPQSIVVTNTRYGSLCLYDVAGSASQNGINSITIDITYTLRLTSCVNEVRSVSYKAELSVLPRSYDLYVVHHQDNRADTLVHRVITVPALS